jgi:hypothetical protein
MMDDVSESRIIEEADFSVTVPETVEMSGFMLVCIEHAKMIDEWKLVTQCAFAGINPEGDTDG